MRDAAVPFQTGMDLLNAYKCGSGETKKIVVRGVEDGYSPAGNEPGFIRPGRRDGSAMWLPRHGTGQYDQVNADRGFTDSFNVPEQVSRGLFVFRARGLNGSDNDTMNFGDLTLREVTAAPGSTGGGEIKLFGADGIWTVQEDVYSADLEAIPVIDRSLGGAVLETQGRSRTYSLKSYFNDRTAPDWLDVFVQDDTVVDFMGLAICSPPEIKRGVTLMPIMPSFPAQQGTVNLACHHAREADRKCDPYVGDTVCSAALPLACLRPGDAPERRDPAGNRFFGHWSGGTIAVTEPVRGDRFRTVREVEGFCEQRFGAGWRVASIGDGFRNQSVAGLGDSRGLTSRVWVDIADQPHATCWARE
ncbi:MAG: hypothetical protein K2Y04_13220 [Caulobacteraceae bacterium]|nr:hypothetical protein [Caulobacteraceae bacterium]